VPVESAGGFAISMLCMIHSIFACKKLKISTVLVTKRVCIELQGAANPIQVQSHHQVPAFPSGH
jgi:hypothetical protein